MRWIPSIRCVLNELVIANELPATGKEKYRENGECDVFPHYLMVTNRAGKSNLALRRAGNGEGFLIPIYVVGFVSAWYWEASVMNHKEASMLMLLVLFAAPAVGHGIECQTLVPYLWDEYGQITIRVAGQSVIANKDTGLFECQSFLPRKSLFESSHNRSDYIVIGNMAPRVYHEVQLLEVN